MTHETKAARASTKAARPGIDDGVNGAEKTGAFANADGVIYEDAKTLSATMPESGPPPSGHPIR